MTLLHLDKVTLRLAEKNQPILHDITYTIHPGEFIILLGANGSGKSSLLKLLYRHYQAHSGNIHFLRKPIGDYTSKEFSNHVATLTQNCAHSLFTSLTLYENYLLMKQKKSLARSSHQTEREALMAYLCDFNSQLAKKLDCTIDQLSGGEMQALALALCLLQPPTLLLLDEHTSALDPKTAEQIMQLTKNMLAKHRITCILTTHNLDFALRYGDRILILNEGKIQETYETADKFLLSKETLMKNYFLA